MLGRCSVGSSASGLPGRGRATRPVGLNSERRLALRVDPREDPDEVSPGPLRAERSGAGRVHRPHLDPAFPSRPHILERVIRPTDPVRCPAVRCQVENRTTAEFGTDQPLPVGTEENYRTLTALINSRPDHRQTGPVFSWVSVSSLSNGKLVNKLMREAFALTALLTLYLDAAHFPLGGKSSFS